MATPLPRPRGGGLHRPASEPRTTCGAWAPRTTRAGTPSALPDKVLCTCSFLLLQRLSLREKKSAQENKRRDSEHR